MEVKMTEEEKALMMSRMAKALPVMRKSLKMTQSELSSLSGVSRAVISNVELGKQDMNWNSFVAIVAVFKTNPDCDKLFNAFDIDLAQVKSYFTVNN